MRIDEPTRAEIVEEIWAACIVKVPRYRGFQGTSIELAVRAGSIDLIECFEMLLDGVPAAEASRVVNFHDTVTERLQQDFMLEELLAADRVTIWPPAPVDPPRSSTGAKMPTPGLAWRLERMHAQGSGPGSRESVQLLPDRLGRHPTVGEAALSATTSPMQTVVVGLRQPPGATRSSFRLPRDRPRRPAPVPGQPRGDRGRAPHRPAGLSPPRSRTPRGRGRRDPSSASGSAGLPGAATCGQLRRGPGRSSASSALAVAVYADLSANDIFRSTCASSSRCSAHPADLAGARSSCAHCDIPRAG